MLNLVRANAQISMIVQSVFDEYELSATAYGVLEVLINSAEPVTPSVISRRMLLPPQTLSHQLNRLESGLLVRFRHEHDRRSVLVQLSDSGSDLVLAVTRALIPVDLQLMSPIDRSDQERLIVLLGSVQRACEALLNRALTNTRPASD